MSNDNIYKDVNVPKLNVFYRKLVAGYFNAVSANPNLTSEYLTEDHFGYGRSKNAFAAVSGGSDLLVIFFYLLGTFGRNSVTTL